MNHIYAAIQEIINGRSPDDVVIQLLQGPAATMNHGILLGAIFATRQSGQEKLALKLEQLQQHIVDLENAEHPLEEAKEVA